MRSLGDIDRYLNLTGTMWTAVGFLILALTASAVTYRSKGAAAAMRTAGWVLLAGSVAAILIITLDRVTGPGFQVSNWTPLAGIRDELSNNNGRLGMVNLVGNAALFGPTGLLAGMLLRHSWAAFLIAPVLSTAIEITQQYVGLSADIDDIILNGVGGALGVCSGLFARRLAQNATK